MHSTRILSITLCLALACLLLTADALAGTTSANVKSYAKETAAINTVYTLPALSGLNNWITRSMNVVRGVGQSFNMILTLGQGAEFVSGNLPTALDLSLDGTTGGTCGGCVSTSIVSGGKDGDSSVTYLVTVGGTGSGIDAFPTMRFDTTPTAGNQWKIKDTLNTLGNGTIQVTVVTTDSATNIEFDSGTSTADWLKGRNGVGIGKDAGLAATRATIDVRKGRVEFVPTVGALAPATNDTAAQDNGATLGIDQSVSGVLNKDGGTYAMLATDFVNLIIEGDLAGIKEIVWDVGGTAGAEVTLESTDTDFNITNGVATFKLLGSPAGSLTGTNTQFRIEVEGDEVLAPRVLTLTVALDFTDGLGGLNANDRDLVSKTTLTTWELNGSVLIANFMNGNNGLFNGRIYLYNPSSSAGDIAVRVFTLPLSGASVQLGGATLDLGSLAGLSGRNIRLAEDILTPLSIALPYLADGGNLVVEVVIEAAGVTGVGQVFQLDLSSFGIYPLSQVN